MRQWTHILTTDWKVLEGVKHVSELEYHRAMSRPDLIDAGWAKLLREVYEGQPNGSGYMSTVRNVFTLTHTQPNFIIHLPETGEPWWEPYEEYLIRLDLFKSYHVMGYRQGYICGTQHFLGPNARRGMMSSSHFQGYKLDILAHVLSKEPL